MKNKPVSKKGVLTVITGPMFSGKTGKLVGMVEVFTKMGYRVLVLKPDIDNRYSSMKEIHSHDHKTAGALLVNGESVKDLVTTILDKEVNKVIIDEAQFFNRTKIKSVVKKLITAGVDVVASGLLYDYKREPFGAMPYLSGLANERLELYAICQKCGAIAQHTERVSGGSAEIEVGAADKYIASCQHCHVIYKR